MGCGVDRTVNSLIGPPAFRPRRSGLYHCFLRSEASVTRRKTGRRAGTVPKYVADLGAMEPCEDGLFVSTTCRVYCTKAATPHTDIGRPIHSAFCAEWVGERDTI